MVADTIEADSGVLIDYGDTRQMIGIEIINASSLIKAKSIERNCDKNPRRGKGVTIIPTEVPTADCGS